MLDAPSRRYDSVHYFELAAVGMSQRMQRFHDALSVVRMQDLLEPFKSGRNVPGDAVQIPKVLRPSCKILFELPLIEPGVCRLLRYFQVNPLLNQVFFRVNGKVSEKDY